MNAFSKDYKPEVDLTDLRRDKKISEVRSKQRKKGLKSDDKDVRAAAMGNLGALSKRGQKI